MVDGTIRAYVFSRIYGAIKAEYETKINNHVCIPSDWLSACKQHDANTMQTSQTRQTRLILYHQPNRICQINWAICIFVLILTRAGKAPWLRCRVRMDIKPVLVLEMDGHVTSPRTSLTTPAYSTPTLRLSNWTSLSYKIRLLFSSYRLSFKSRFVSQSQWQQKWYLAPTTEASSPTSTSSKPTTKS